MGSVRFGTGTSANLTYYPYGEEYTAGSDDAEKFGTYFRDSTSGLDYAQNRYYNSILGRFMTADPSRSNALTDPGQWNRYAYVGNDPVNFYDPHGLDECPAGAFCIGYNPPAAPQPSPIVWDGYVAGGLNTGGGGGGGPWSGLAAAALQAGLARAQQLASMQKQFSKEVQKAGKSALNALQNPDCAGLFGLTPGSPAPASVLGLTANRGSFRRDHDGR